MSKKWFFSLVGIIIIIIGVGSYIYFSEKKELPPSSSSIIKRKIEEKKIVKPKESLSSEISKEQEVITSQKNTKKESELKSLESPNIKIVEKKKSISQPSWTEKFFVTYFFIEDLCKFIISSYYPPYSLNNPTDKALLNLNFKVINARYGVELLGFRIHTQNVKEARKKILSYLMNPEILEAIYSKYGDLFIKELYDLSKETEKTFVLENKKEKRTLNPLEIKTLFLLLSDYLYQISKVLSTLANNPDIFYMVKRYIKAQNDSVHFNFLLNQILNKYKTVSKNDKNALNELKIKKERVIQEYKKAIQNRESIRRSILEKFKKYDFTIADHEVLYIVEWFYRRFYTNPNTKVLISLSDILDDLSKKLKERAKEI